MPGIKKPCHSKLTTLRVIAPKPSSQEPMITKTCCQEQQQEQQEQQRQGEGEGEVCACAETGAKKCCSEDKVNEEGQKIRIVTCRCGDSCACPGCDAHPSRAMRGKQDPYAGYATSDLDPRRRLSIAAICDSSDAPTPKLVSEDRPTLVLAEDGTELCGCGCAMPYEACSNCLNELCRGKKKKKEAIDVSVGFSGHLTNNEGGNLFLFLSITAHYDVAFPDV